MEQMTTTFVATQEFLRSQLDEKTDKIIQLEKALEAARDINRSNAREINDTRDAIQAWTLEELENGQLTESQSEEIAGICGFELTKEVEVEVTVTYSMTVTTGPTDDVEDIVNNINFNSIDYDSGSIDLQDVSIDRVDF
jgi:vacuolar-type H+-ATPase subunit I/STV1